MSGCQILEWSAITPVCLTCIGLLFLTGINKQFSFELVNIPMDREKGEWRYSEPSWRLLQLCWLHIWKMDTSVPWRVGRWKQVCYKEQVHLVLSNEGLIYLGKFHSAPCSSAWFCFAATLFISIAPCSIVVLMFYSRESLYQGTVTWLLSVDIVLCRTWHYASSMTSFNCMLYCTRL